MTDAIREARSFVRGKTRASLDRSRILALALVREIEIVGEAAARITEVFKKAHPEIPWTAIVGTRNRLVHGYFDTDLDIVWETIRSDLPDLARRLKSLI